jgi:hypothetical protein
VLSRLIRQAEDAFPDLPAVLREHPADQGWGLPFENPRLLMRILQKSQMLVDLVYRDRVTLIVVPVQGIAAEVHYWLNMAGLRIPRDISLLALSLGNTDEFTPLPISILDWGLHRLAYRCLCCFLPSTAQSMRRLSHIGAEPTLVDNGTLATLNGAPSDPVCRRSCCLDLPPEDFRLRGK